MKLKDFNFNEIPVRGLSIFLNDEEVAMGFVGETLRKIAPLNLAEKETKETNIYFDTFIIRL